MLNFYQGNKRTKEFKGLLIGLLSGLLLFIIIICAAFYNLKREYEISQSMLHSHEKVYQIESTISLVKDYETSARGLILSNQDHYAKLLPQMAQSLDHALVILAKQIANDVAQQKRLDSLSFYLHKNVAFSTLVIRLRREKGLEEAMRLVSANKGLAYMKKIHQIARAMQMHEKQVLAQQKKESKKAIHFTKQILVASQVFFVFFVFFVLLLLYVLWKGWQQKQKNRQHQEGLHHPGMPIKGLNRVKHENDHYVKPESENINLLHPESVQAMVTNFREVSAGINAGLDVQNANTLLIKAINHLSRILDSSRDVICAIDAQGRFLQVSSAAATVWGYAPEELIGRPYMDLVADQDKEATAQLTDSLLSEIKVTNFENHYVRPDGSLVPLQWSAKWIEEDQVMYYIARDVTEKKKLESASRNEWKRFNDLFMQAPTSICVLKGADHRFIMTNPFYDQLTGSRSLIGKTVKEAFPELAQQEYLEILDQVFKTGEPYIGKECLVRLDQEGNGQLTDIYVNMLYQVYYNSEGKVEGVFCFGVDVSEQVQSRKKIQESESRFRQLIQELPAAVYTCDVAGSIQLFNKAAVELWGREPQVGQDRWTGSWKVYDAAGEPLAQENLPIALTLKTGVPVQGQEIIIERPNGERRHVMPHPVLRFDAAGQLSGATNILIDITESKNASDLIRRSETALAEAQRIAKIGSWNLDLQTQGLTCSEQLYHVFDADAENFEETFTNFLHFAGGAPQHLDRQTPPKAFTKEGPFVVEYRIITKKGESRIIQVMGQSQADARGQVMRLYGTAQDITERKQFETALLASEEKYKLLFYQAPMPKWIYDLHTFQILDVNESAIEHYGYSREEFLSLSVKDLRPVEDVAALVSTLRERGDDKRPFRFGICDHIKKDGTHIQVEISGHNIQYDNQECLMVEVNDVTEKARAEQALKVSNNRWETVSKVTYDAIWDRDMKTNELFFGDNFEILFGHPVENKNKNYQIWLSYLHPEDKQRVQDSLAAFLLSQETIWKEDYRFLKASGEYAYCTDRGILLRDEQGVPYRMIGALRDVTAGRMAKENLRIEKAFSEALLEASPDGMVGFNDKGEIILFNKKAEILFGYSAQEILGSPLAALLPEMAQAAIQHKSEDFFANPAEKKLQDSNQEMVCLRKDGSKVPVDVRTNLLHSYKGKIVLISVRDITRRKLAERRLKESEKNMSAILSSTQEAIYLLDLNCRLVLLNDHSHDFIKQAYDVACKPGDDFQTLFSPEVNSKLRSIYEKVLAGEKHESDLRFELREDEAYYHFSYFPVRDDEGNIIGICCSSTDISERKKNEEAMKIANAEKEEYQYRLKAILDYSPQGILIKDMDGNHFFSNKAFLKLFNLERDKDVSQQLKVAFDDQVARAEFLVTGEQHQANEIMAKEWKQQVILTNGQTVELEIIKFPLYDRQKKLFGICTMCKDITEQMMHQQQLIAARKNAEQAEQLQEQFLANMSHELRTPMNGIIGMVNLLLTSNSIQTEEAGRLQIIKRSSDTLLNLINDILDLSKIKAGMLSIEKVNFDFNESVASTAMSFKERALQKGIKLHVSADPFMPGLLSGDPHRLNQILNNLLSNAIKFTEQGFVRLEASLQSETENEVVVACIVSDSGIGIAADKLPYIFDNFVQASSDISSKYGGTGLGLAITKRLIEMQGGEMTVASTLGTGTTFTFHLPYAIPKGAKAVVPLYSDEYETLKKDYCGKRALIVEDNEINQAVLASSLKHFHLDCHIASHGQEAIGLLASGERFDIIFMDLRMPFMNGFEATAYIRQKLHLQVPIVILTASVLRNERERALSIGASVYIAKPFAMADLAQTLEQCLPSPEHQPETNLAASLAGPTPRPVTVADFNISQLLELEDPEHIRQIMDLFTEKIPLYFQKLQSYLPDDNWKGFLDKAHKIKGSFSLIQIQEIYQLVLTMEAKVEAEQNLREVAPLLEKSLSLLTQLIPALKQEVENQLIALETNL